MLESDLKNFNKTIQYITKSKKKIKKKQFGKELNASGVVFLDLDNVLLFTPKIGDIVRLTNFSEAAIHSMFNELPKTLIQNMDTISFGPINPHQNLLFWKMATEDYYLCTSTEVIKLFQFLSTRGIAFIIISRGKRVGLWNILEKYMIELGINCIPTFEFFLVGRNYKKQEMCWKTKWDDHHRHRQNYPQKVDVIISLLKDTFPKIDPSNDVMFVDDLKENRQHVKDAGIQVCDSMHLFNEHYIFSHSQLNKIKKWYEEIQKQDFDDGFGDDIKVENCYENDEEKGEKHKNTTA